MKVCLRGYFTQARLVFWGPKSAWEHLDTIKQVKSHIKRKRTFLKRCFQLSGFFSAHIREKGEKNGPVIATIFTTEQTTWKSSKGKQASTYAIFSRSNSAIDQILKFTQKCRFASTQCFYISSGVLKNVPETFRNLCCDVDIFVLLFDASTSGF